MGWLAKLRGVRPEQQAALYAGVVARGRAPHWYLDGRVPDTLDGRFDMIAAVLATVLLRLEQAPEGADAAGLEIGARLTERFVEDMDGQLRQEGIGDIVVGKHIGRMMAMLGGRLGAYRDGWAAGDIGPALRRNLYRGDAPDAAAVAHVAHSLSELRGRLQAVPLDALAAGALP